MNLCKRVTIFEGPDGSGKSTAAKAYAEATGARLVHCGPFPRQTAVGLGRTYLEAMLPALLGYQDVVLDRCWTSEPIYGAVFRHGADRLEEAGRRILERVAMRCDARMVLCLPDADTCLESWRRRHAEGNEYLDREAQLLMVHQLYQMPELTQLPIQVHDYTKDPQGIGFRAFLSQGNTACHEINDHTAGSRNARVLLVGESLSEITDRNGLSTWYPFCDLSLTGCTWWFTNLLAVAGVREMDLIWVNAGDAPETQDLLQVPHVVALGRVAETWCLRHDSVVFAKFPHPQAWRRFHANETYPLIKYLREATQS